MRKRWIPALALVGLCGLVAWAGVRMVGGQTASGVASGQTTARNVEAVRVIRYLNTAEQQHRVRFGRFGSYSDLQGAGVLGQAGRLVALPPSDQPAGAPGVAPGSIPAGFSLRLLTSADGSAYSIALADTTVGDCGISFFTDGGGGHVPTVRLPGARRKIDAVESHSRVVAHVCATRVSHVLDAARCYQELLGTASPLQRWLPA